MIIDRVERKCQTRSHRVGAIAPGEYNHAQGVLRRGEKGMVVTFAEGVSAVAMETAVTLVWAGRGMRCGDNSVRSLKGGVP